MKPDRRKQPLPHHPAPTAGTCKTAERTFEIDRLHQRIEKDIDTTSLFAGKTLQLRQELANIFRDDIANQPLLIAVFEMPPPKLLPDQKRWICHMGGVRTQLLDNTNGAFLPHAYVTEPAKTASADFGSPLPSPSMARTFSPSQRRNDHFETPRSNQYADLHEWPVSVKIARLTLTLSFGEPSTGFVGPSIFNPAGFCESRQCSFD